MAAGVFATIAVSGLAACGSSAKTATSSSGSTSTSSGSAATAAPSAAAYTISTASLPGLGTVLVNGEGRTLYLLTSEKGGKLTCTDDNGCTKVWPDTELPSGVTQAIAGTGVQASLLGTIKSTTGSLYVTYGGWPLYEYSGDPGPGKANGQGIVSFGGTWYAVTAAGAAAGQSSTTKTSTSGSGGYGY
jgi:predicted lipoprotein with Yx(FWY)xxD motif